MNDSRIKTVQAMSSKRCELDILTFLPQLSKDPCSIKTSQLQLFFPTKSLSHEGDLTSSILASFSPLLSQ